MIEITVNGGGVSLDEPHTGDRLLAHLGVAPGTVVIELNGEVITSEIFLKRRLVEGDVLELVTVVGGG